jgi:hypothetical protein
LNREVIGIEFKLALKFQQPERVEGTSFGSVMREVLSMPTIGMLALRNSVARVCSLATDRMAV